MKGSQTQHSKAAADGRVGDFERNGFKVGVGDRVSLQDDAGWKFTLLERDSFRDMIADLELGELDFIIVDEPIAKRLVERKILNAAVFSLQPYLSDYYTDVVGYEKEEYALAVADPEIHKWIKSIMADSAISEEIEAAIATEPRILRSSSWHP